MITEQEESILCHLDRLKHLIKNVLSKGQYTIAKRYQEYYDQVINEPDIKEIIVKNNATQHL
jgi:hypothetical protein